MFAVLTVILSDKLLKVISAFERKSEAKCVFRAHTGLLCPACGNTRCVSSLLNGDLFAAISYNAFTVALLLFCMGLYAELLANSFGRTAAVIPRSYRFLTVVLTLSAAYFILRNIFPFLTAA